MGFRQRFEFGLAWRALVLLGALALLLAALHTPGLAAGRIVAGLLCLAALYGLWSHIRRTNFELARFIEALRFDDFSQRFASPSGGGFDVLGQAMDAVMRTLRDRRVKMAQEARFYAAAIDDAPIVLISIADDGTVATLNKAARRLFERAVPTRVEDFELYGSEFAAAIALPPGHRRVTRINLHGVPQRIILATARLERLGSGITIASLLPVQAELGRVEMTTQADLVRVLTHEIMNSLTPVTSLAHSSADLVAVAAAKDHSLDDALTAVRTLATRADGILRFVESYRDFAFASDLRRRRFDARGWAEEVAVLANADPRLEGRALSVTVEPPKTEVDADPDLLAQVALNLIRNSALAGAKRIELRIAAVPSGRVLIEVADNGPGIPQERREDVFMPFFTTRSNGSGVGLSFAKQVILAHGGSIAAQTSELGGASIRALL